MAKKLMAWKTKGMNRDLSVSAFNPEFAFENRNLRLGTNESNTMMSWVNERGTKRINIVRGKWNPEDEERTDVTEIIGTPIGTAVINHQLVVFTTDTLHNHDYIYVLKYADSAKEDMLCKMLFGGENLSLGFRVDHPLETLVSYESEKIQKVYWTDGINQPRVINIEGKIRENNIHQFDFVPQLNLQEEIHVQKQLGTSGMFAPGVIQYAFTYYRKYGQESCIFYTTPLIYISYKDRGASPEDKVDNAFKITVENLDMSFDYLRIYSIHRTSLNATPIVKRVQDIDLSGTEVMNSSEDVKRYKTSFLDTGTSGENIDPAELLYKGGDTVTVGTLEQKDNTLFLGDICLTRPFIEDTLRESIKQKDGEEEKIQQATRQISIESGTTGGYPYANQLSAVDQNGYTIPCGGFKYGDYYRCGVQFQYKTGKWSDPVWIDDTDVTNHPIMDSTGKNVTLPSLTGTLSAEIVNELMDADYKKARAVVVFPNIQDRKIVCQGVVCPTLYTEKHRRTECDLYAQSSWFFRAPEAGAASSENSNKAVIPAGEGTLPYTSRQVTNDTPKNLTAPYNPTYIRRVEVQGDYDQENKFNVDRSFLTFHSPELEFDTQMYSLNFDNTQWQKVGTSTFFKTLSDIDIQTDTPTISTDGSGFQHRTFVSDGLYGIISGLFYDDYTLDDGGGSGKTDYIEQYRNENSSVKWLVYLWNKTGSLNNDITRPADQGTASAILKKKVISNLRVASTVEWDTGTITPRGYADNQKPQFFSSDQATILKFGESIYQGNVDTLLTPDHKDGQYFAFSGNLSNLKANSVDTKFTSAIQCKTFGKYKDGSSEVSESGFWGWASSGWSRKDGNIGDGYKDLVLKKQPVRMKYKSTPHLAFGLPLGAGDWSKQWALPVYEITNPDNSMRFGGNSMDALRENIWLPCGEPVSLVRGNPVTFNYDYGDTYYQRWDCLKTYPFTPEDTNQLVEIGSFVLETRVNIDGRYDRNRGQLNNLNMTPTNFNLINPIYSQQDNFFQYRIRDKDYYSNNSFYNQITWSLPKTSGADVDSWTNTTLSTNLELDGNKGRITSLKRFNNELICFQETAISRILYNENFMLSTQQGVPIEIANSGKVQGKAYLSDTIGCSNKWSITSGTGGLYFMESEGKSIYLFNGQLGNLSLQQGFNSWAKLYIPSNDWKWTPIFPENYDKSAFVSYYDKLNQEILFINHSLCLAFSEKFGVFTSFYDYHNTPFFCNLDDTGIWLRANQLWKHQAGDYCKFFGASRPYSMVLVGNPEPTLDKIFTNIEFRACVDNDGRIEDSRFVPYLPFDSLDTWNEYQHGIAYLNNMRGHSAMEHHTLDNEASLKRKFRIWRCDIPRDNGDTVDTFDETFDETFHPIARDKKHPMDRMRNPWLYLRLRKDEESSNRRTEIHDIVMTYFG